LQWHRINHCKWTKLYLFFCKYFLRSYPVTPKGSDSISIYNIYFYKMITKLPEDIQGIIVNYLEPKEKRLLNSAIILPEYTSKQISDTTQISGKRIVLVFLLRKHIRQLFALLDKYIPSYTYSLCNYSSIYLPYNDQCLMFAPKNQHNLICRFCDKYRIDHKYWKMMNIYFQLRCIF
jgi:hypothetical protein